MSTDSEVDLIAMLKAGEEQAYVRLINEYGGPMLAVARRYMRSEEDARDCFQDACVQVVKAIHKFEQRSTLKTWVHRIVVNACLMKLRKQRQGSAQEVEFDESAPQFDDHGLRIEPDWNLGNSAESLVTEQKNRQFVLTAIDSLPDDFRNVLLLRDIEEYSTRETAALLEVSDAVIKTRLHRARAALKHRLEPLYRKES